MSQPEPKQVIHQVIASYWVSIRVYRDRLRRSEQVDKPLQWHNLPQAVRVKWDWYFQYRAALLQVKYPKCLVLVQWGHEVAKDVTLCHILQKQISAKQGQITKGQQALRQIEADYIAHPFFSQSGTIQDYAPAYEKLLFKVNRKLQELRDLQLQLIDATVAER